jgi:hypothetical protein
MSGEFVDLCAFGLFNVDKAEDVNTELAGKINFVESRDRPVFFIF